MNAESHVGLLDNPAKSSLHVVPRVSLKARAVQQIRQAIERGELKAGQALTELGLARKLGVAQPTVREALLELEFIGFVQRAGVRRTQVTVLTRRVIDDIYLVRTRLETLAVEIIASKDILDLKLCRDQVERMGSAAREGRMTEFFNADLNFHRALWRISGNESLENSLERLVPKLFAFGIIQHARLSSQQFINVTDLHRRLLDLLAGRDVVRAREFMELSMEKAWLDDAQLPELG